MSLRTTVPEDIYQFEWPSGSAVSPDGQFVVYEKSVARVQENDYETHLYVSDLQNKTGRILTSTGTSNRNPVWAPNGKTIAFLSNHSFGTQVWLLSLEGGEARCLTRFKQGISSIVWSPDGKVIYGLVPVAPGNEVEVFSENISKDEARDTIMKEQRDWVGGSKIYKSLYYKNDGGGLQTPFVLQIIGIDVTTGNFIQLTKGTNDATELDVSPDGNSIAFISCREDESPLFGGQIYRVSASGGEVELFYDNAKVSSPSYSPDGKWLAFFAHRTNQNQLFIMPANGGEARCVSQHYPDTLSDMIFTDMRYIRYPLRPQWSINSQHVFALGTRNGRNEIVRFSINDSKVKPSAVVGGDRTIFHFSYDGDQTIAVAYSTFTHPGKVAVIKVKELGNEIEKRNPNEDFSNHEWSFFPEHEVRLDDCNDQLLSELIVGVPEVFSFHSEDDWRIQGFILKPVHFNPNKKYPVLLDIHGGPHSVFGFSYFHQMQVFAAQGFAVVYINPRGSSGFGEEFTNAVCGDYGGKDMADLLNGLDVALKQFDFLDKNQVAVNGISYGGFMVNWLVTHTDRFIAAVSEGSISNWISMDGTSDISPAFMKQEFLGKTDFETLWKFSPLAYVDNVKTPLLLLHNENDLRCPIEQAEQFYSHIKRRGGEVEFVRIPDSSHALLQYGKPGLRIARLQSMLHFVKAHLQDYAVTGGK